MTTDYTKITEMAGAEISQEQLERLCHRYYFAGPFCTEKDVIEAACGTGPGLGYLAERAQSLRAGDFTHEILAVPRQHYGDRIDLRQFDAQSMPFASHSADTILLYEAIYYLLSAEQFVNECRRVLRPGGKVLIATANKDLYDFNPSPNSYVYYGVVELQQLFAKGGFDAECFGYLAVDEISLRQRMLRPTKKLAVRLNLMPKSADGKKWLKRIVFGSMTAMPAEITADIADYTPPVRLPTDRPDRKHKVIYCVATLDSTPQSR